MKLNLFRSVGKKSGGKSQGAATSSLADETVTEQVYIRFNKPRIS